MRRSRDHDAPILQGLAQGFQNVAAKLEQLIEKEDAMMREAHLPGPWWIATANEPRIGDRVVWGTEGSAPDECASRCERTGHGVHRRDLERLPLGEGGENSRETPGQHRLAGTRRPGEQRVVSARGSDLERPLGGLLSGDVAEVIDVFGNRQSRWRWCLVKRALPQLADERLKGGRGRERRAANETRLGHVRRGHDQGLLPSRL